MALELHTPRLLLRQWRESDRDPWAAMNADPEVMRHYPATLTRTEADAAFDRAAERLRDSEFGLWALERADTGEFIGYTGLWRPTFEAAFTPCVEIGWRLMRSAWGQGFATEAAGASLDHGFTSAGLEEIVSFTAHTNQRSWMVMRRLGMHSDPEESFAHPNLPPEHRLSPHVLYRITAGEWAARRIGQ